MGLGVFYWEPECFNNWQGYNMGAFTNDGKPSVAMDAFLNQYSSVKNKKNAPSAKAEDAFLINTMKRISSSLQYKYLQ